MRRPSRARGRRYGALLIDSMPPATAMSMSPSAMPCAASMTAFNPEPQTLLMVSAATSLLRPPPSAACRAGAWPTPADNTLPHDALVDRGGIDAGARDSLAHGNGAELRRLEILSARREIFPMACARR